MAIFGFKKRKDDKLEQNASAAKGAAQKKAGAKPAKRTAAPKAVKAVKVAAPAVIAGVESHSASVILRPRITEKSGILSQMGVYTFEVSKNSNKDSIAKAVKVLYKVSPVKIAVSNLPARNVFVKGRHGTVSGMKKAMVTLKKGDKIDFV